MTSRAIAAIALAVVVLVVAWATRVAAGARDLAEAEAAMTRGDVASAILAARAAAEARCPACSAPDRGFEKLESIAKDAESRGDETTAFAAWRAIRAASIATFFGSARRDRADREIARVGHLVDLAVAASGGTPAAAATEERLANALAAGDPPSSAAFAVVAAGTALFFWGAARFVLGRAARKSDALLAAAGAAIASMGTLFF